MAIHRPSIFGEYLPDSSGEAYIEPYTVKATNGNWAIPVKIFNDSATKEGFHGFFNVPQNYVGCTNLIVAWTAQALVGNWKIDFEYRAVGGNDFESLDQATPQESVTAFDTAPSAVNNLMEISIPLTDGNFLPGDKVEYILSRDGTDIGTTLAGAITLIDAQFEYADE